mgnify:CR=1 FL=1
MKFQAAIHGVTFNEDPPLVKTKPKANVIPGFAFGDPADYEEMPQEERQKLTDKMMGVHRQVLRDVM